MNRNIAKFFLEHVENLRAQSYTAPEYLQCLRAFWKKVQAGSAYRKLLMIHAATHLNDLRVPPANHLESLKGTRQAIYSIRINDQWRICFFWQENDAYEVEIVDYH